MCGLLPGGSSFPPATVSLPCLLLSVVSAEHVPLPLACASLVWSLRCPWCTAATSQRWLPSRWDPPPTQAATLVPLLPLPKLLPLSHCCQYPSCYPCPTAANTQAATLAPLLPIPKPRLVFDTSALAAVRLSCVLWHSCCLHLSRRKRTSKPFLWPAWTRVCRPMPSLRCLAAVHGRGGVAVEQGSCCCM